MLNRTHNSDRPTPPSEYEQNQQPLAQAESHAIRTASAISSLRVLPEYSAEYLASTSKNRKTQATYWLALLHFQQYAEAEQLTLLSVPLQPEKLHKEVLARFVVWLQQEGYSNNSIRVFIASAKQYLLWLQNESRLPIGLRVDEMQRALERKAGPHMQSIPAERHRADKAVGRLLNYYGKLLKTPLPNTPRGRRQKLAYLRNHAILQTLYSTAGRASEVAALTRAQVKDGKAQLTEITGRGGRKRLVYFTSEAQKAIQAYLAARADLQSEHFAARGSVDKSDALFVRHDRDTPTAVTTKTVWQIVNEAAKAVFGSDERGRPLKRVGPHAFRHLRAQHLYDDEMPIDMIQAILGHSSVVTTRNIYASRTSAESLVKGLEKYGRNLTKVAKGE